jgi:hypothetical protein
MDSAIQGRFQTEVILIETAWVGLQDELDDVAVDRCLAVSGGGCWAYGSGRYRVRSDCLVRVPKGLAVATRLHQTTERVEVWIIGPACTTSLTAWAWLTITGLYGMLYQRRIDGEVICLH